MASSIEFTPNKSQGGALQLPCQRCVGKTQHTVVASLDERGDDEHGDYTVSWTTEYQVVQCAGCKSVSFRQASSNSEACYPVGPDEWEYEVNEKLYPSRIAGRTGLGDGVYHLPASVRQIYEETLAVLANQSPILAGIGLRALLESVCKEKKAKGNDLLAKIDSLVSSNVLTPASAAILHKIRTLGNAAAHEVKPHSEKQLGLAMDIVEHLLRDVYILPNEVKAEFPDEA